MIGFSTAGKLNPPGIPLWDRYFHPRIGGAVSVGGSRSNSRSIRYRYYLLVIFLDLFRGFRAKAFGRSIGVQLWFYQNQVLPRQNMHLMEYRNLGPTKFSGQSHFGFWIPKLAR